MCGQHTFISFTTQYTTAGSQVITPVGSMQFQGIEGRQHKRQHASIFERWPVIAAHTVYGRTKRKELNKKKAELQREVEVKPLICRICDGSDVQHVN